MISGVPDRSWLSSVPAPVPPMFTLAGACGLLPDRISPGNRFAVLLDALEVVPAALEVASDAVGTARTAESVVAGTPLRETDAWGLGGGRLVGLLEDAFGLLGLAYAGVQLDGLAEQTRVAAARIRRVNTDGVALLAMFGTAAGFRGIADELLALRAGLSAMDTTWPQLGRERPTLRHTSDGRMTARDIEPDRPGPTSSARSGARREAVGFLVGQASGLAQDAFRSWALPTLAGSGCCPASKAGPAGRQYRCGEWRGAYSRPVGSHVNGRAECGTGRVVALAVAAVSLTTDAVGDALTGNGERERVGANDMAQHVRDEMYLQAVQVLSEAGALPSQQPGATTLPDSPGVVDGRALTADQIADLPPEEQRAAREDLVSLAVDPGNDLQGIPPQGLGAYVNQELLELAYGGAFDEYFPP